MPRAARIALAGVVFHVINRGVGRGEIFAQDELMVARYIERNALRAGLAPSAQQWRWSSLWRRVGRGGDEHQPPLPLAVWPVEQPRNWLTWVNRPQTQAELDAIRLSVAKGKPFGEARWQQRMTRRPGLQSSHRPAGRPRKRRE